MKTNLLMHSLRRILANKAFRIALLAMGVLAIALVYAHSKLVASRQVLISGRLVRLDRLPYVDVLDLRLSRMTRVQLAPERPVLVVFLSAADCWTCMGELPSWKVLSEKYPNQLNEMFIFVRSSGSEVSALTHADLLAPSASVYLDQNGDVDRKLGIPPVTPLTVLMHGGTRKVLLAEGSDNDPDSEDRFVASVETAVQRVSATATYPVVDEVREH